MAHERSITLPARLAAVTPPERDAAPTPAAARAAAPTPPDTSAQEAGQVGAAIAALHRAAAELRGRHLSDLRGLQETAVELGIIVAERLLRVNLAAGNHAVEVAVREAVSRLRPRAPVTVRLHPLDLELLRTRAGEQGIAAADEDVQLVADVTLLRGECRAEAAGAVAWVNPLGLLDELREQLLEGLDDHGAVAGSAA